MKNFDFSSIIVPLEEEKYENYINRLVENRPKGLSNRPKNIYTERHHIFPKSLGGKDSEENIIILLPEEHYYCHKLLAIENPTISQLQFAWWRTCHYIDSDSKRLYHISIEDYACARKRIAEESSKMNSIPIVELNSGTIYKSAEEAARVLGILKAANITACCKKRANSANGYRFCYLSDYEEGNYEILPIRNGKKLVDIDTGEVYESSIEAGEKLNLQPVKIREVCRGLRKSTKGHRFVYYEDYINNNYEVKPIGHIGKPVQDLETGIVYKSAAQAAKELNLDPSSILKVCHGKIKST